MTPTPARWALPSVTRVAVAWLVQGFGAGNAGTKRPDAAMLPYRLVTLVAGTETAEKTQRCGIVSVHTFDKSMDLAEDGAEKTDEWMKQLGPPLYPAQAVTITRADSTTQVVYPRSVCTHQIPIWVDYRDDLIFRFVARYEITVGIVANT
jgi:hypothetical protein